MRRHPQMTDRAKLASSVAFQAPRNEAMTPEQILDYLLMKGVNLRAIQPNRLEVSGPLSALTPALLDRLKANEATLARYCFDHESSLTRQCRQLQQNAEAIARRYQGSVDIDGKRTRVDLEPIALVAQKERAA